MSSRYITLAAGACLLASAVITNIANAQDTGIEEVIVTAQRQAESIQDVPIAVTALSGEMLDDKQVVTVSDLQMNAPNVNFTPTNFGSNSFSIRGIGRLVTSSTGDAGVSIHINDIAVGTNLTAIEFYDMERVEVLRGPQGTLYGKNATGGVVNFVTRKPDFDSYNGFLDVEAGDNAHRRVKGALNIPVADNFALRVAAFKLDRDGYIENTAYKQPGLDGRLIPNINDDIDGRNIFSGRVTANWDINDNMNLWVQYSMFNEDDDRARITNQVCTRGPLPTYGCLADSKDFDTPHLTATFDTLVGALYGLGDLGNPDITGVYNWPKPSDVGFRKMHTDFEPKYEYEEDLVTFGFTWEFDNMTFGLVGGYLEWDALYQQDYNMDVGPELPPNFYRSDGLYPVSNPAGRAGDDWRDGPCNLRDGTAGALGVRGANSAPGPCTYGVYTNRFTFDQADSTGDYYTVEAKFQSSFDGPFNFLVGGLYFDGESWGDYYVMSNFLDARPDSYPGFFDNTSDPDGGVFGEGYAVFGEAYYDVTDRIKLTLGLRYNHDDKRVKDTSVLWNTTDINFPLSSALGPLLAGVELPAFHTRVPDFVLGDPGADGLPAAESALLSLYADEASIAAAAATPARSDERVAIAGLVPLVPEFSETRIITGSPEKFNWKETTGRIGIDWAVGEDTMLYFFYSRGYKPGGANPAIPTQFQGESQFDYDNEKIDAFEVGFKSTLLDGSMVLNGSLFTYDYAGLQVARIKNNTSLNENIDADIMGAELEWQWRPEFAPRLSIDAQYSWLDTEVKGSQSVDPLDREAGNPDFITLNDFAFLYAARRDQITPEIIALATSLGAAFPVPGATYDDGLPVVFSRAFLNAVGVETVEGIPTDLDGNQLPNAPEHSIHLGLAYTFDVPVLSGTVTARWDYFWQDDSYSREFNRVGDEIDAWDQHNASLIYESNDGKWTGRVWVRNIQDEDNVTGHYVTSDTSGYFRNYFLTEPRVYGATIRYSFGN